MEVFLRYRGQRRAAERMDVTLLDLLVRDRYQLGNPSGLAGLLGTDEVACVVNADLLANSPAPAPVADRAKRIADKTLCNGVSSSPSPITLPRV